MTSHATAFVIRVTAKQYADAARQLRDGDVESNPVRLAFAEGGEFVLSALDNSHIALMDIRTGHHYSGAVPEVLVQYLAGFQRGRKISEDHEFELVLTSVDG